MGLTAQGAGVGRFNAKKLNSYLYGLNKRLEDENKVLVERITELEAESRSKGTSTSPAASSSSSSAPGRFVNAGRGRARVSVSPGGLGNVEEEEEENDLSGEKAELEMIIQGLQGELEKCNREKEEYETKFNAERALDRQRWRDRMSEVEKGVENIVRDLEQKLDKAEADAKETARRIEAIGAERDVALEKVENAERALAAEADIGKEMNIVNEELGRLSGELKKANLRVRNLEDDLGERNIKIAQLGAELKDEKDVVEGLDQELATRLDEIENLRKQVDEQSKRVKVNADELRDTKGYVAELEAEAEAATERIQTVETELESIQARLRETVNEGIHAQGRVEELEEEVLRLNELGHQMQEALEVAGRKDQSHDDEIAELQGTIYALERELGREKDKSRSLSRVAESPMVPNAEIEALEDELDDAHREIARLKALMQQSPARKVMDAAKDNRIGMLEMEREDLLKRVQVLRGALNGTPSKVVNDITVASVASPFHRPLVSMSSPKTPGAPLRDVSGVLTRPRSVHRS
jgi:chromosome segregation ATPase